MPIQKLTQQFLANASKPAPRWFRKSKMLVNIVTNFVVALMMIHGKRSDDIILLEVKLSQSFLMEILDLVLANGEEYVVKPSAPNDIELQNK